MIQSFEVSQFIKHTGETCDAVILGGDFNFRPSQLGYSIIRYNSNLQDAWLAQVFATSTSTPSGLEALAASTFKISLLNNGGGETVNLLMTSMGNYQLILKRS